MIHEPNTPPEFALFVADRIAIGTKLWLQSIFLGLAVSNSEAHIHSLPMIGSYSADCWIFWAYEYLLKEVAKNVNVERRNTAMRTLWGEFDMTQSLLLVWNTFYLFTVFRTFYGLRSLRLFPWLFVDASDLFGSRAKGESLPLRWLLTNFFVFFLYQNRQISCDSCALSKPFYTFCD